MEIQNSVFSLILFSPSVMLKYEESFWSIHCYFDSKDNLGKRYYINYK